MNTVQEHWGIFEKLVIPLEVTKEQKSEIKKSFYAGAAAVHFMLSKKSLNEEAAKAILDGVYKESMDFFWGKE